MSTKFKGKMPKEIWQLSFALACLFAVAFAITACSSGTMNTASGMGTVSVMLSDPATCQAPDGPYAHVYVTITDVQANVSSTASPTDGSWVDLTPNLSKNPKQVDLLGLANNQCFLMTLGDSLQLQAGSYQQIRVMLASNSASISNNACGSAANCVVLTADNSVHALNLSSEAQTGIKIPSGQIASGAFTIGAGQTKDLDIDFNTCESIVLQGNGQYRLMPVLHAGEVSTTSTSINGTVVDAATGKPVVGSAVVVLEQNINGIDRPVGGSSKVVNTDGTFVYCPLPAGTYDVVVVGTTSGGAFYQPSIVTGVSVGSTTGTIKLYLPTASTNASLAGTVSSQNSSNQGTVADVQVSALETVNSTKYTIPLPLTSTQTSATLNVETAPGSGCSAGTDCAPYTLNVPGGAVNIGAWASSGVTLTVSTSLASYNVDGLAVVPGSGGTPDCNPSEITTTPATTLTSSTLNVTGLDLAFKSCN